MISASSCFIALEPTQYLRFKQMFMIWALSKIEQFFSINVPTVKTNLTKYCKKKYSSEQIHNNIWKRRINYFKLKLIHSSSNKLTRIWINNTELKTIRSSKVVSTFSHDSPKINVCNLCPSHPTGSLDPVFPQRVGAEHECSQQKRFNVLLFQMNDWRSLRKAKNEHRWKRNAVTHFMGRKSFDKEPLLEKGCKFTRN